MEIGSVPTNQPAPAVAPQASPETRSENRELIQDPNLIYPDWELTIPRDWPHNYTVGMGESLWRIAGYWEIYGDSTMWNVIFDANTDQISNPDMIQPGMVLMVPR